MVEHLRQVEDEAVLAIACADILEETSRVFPQLQGTEGRNSCQRRESHSDCPRRR